jgi:hypothetical protein
VSLRSRNVHAILRSNGRMPRSHESPPGDAQLRCTRVASGSDRWRWNGHGAAVNVRAPSTWLHGFRLAALAYATVSQVGDDALSVRLRPVVPAVSAPSIPRRPSPGYRSPCDVGDWRCGRRPRRLDIRFKRGPVVCSDARWSVRPTHSVVLKHSASDRWGGKGRRIHRRLPRLPVRRAARQVLHVALARSE